MSSRLRSVTCSLLALLATMGATPADAQDAPIETQPDDASQSESPQSPEAVALDDEVRETGAVRSAEDAEYDLQINRALREFGAGQYSEAATHFRAAYRIRPSSRVLRGLGKAYFELGDYLEASTAFEQALHGSAPLEGALRVEVEALLTRSEQHIGRLMIHVLPSEATIRVGTREVEAGSVRVNAGEVEVSATASGFAPERRTVAVLGGERQDVQIELSLSSQVTIVERNRASSYVAGALGLASIGGTVAGAFWVRDRRRALDRCALEGVRCANQGRLDGERNAAIVVTALSAAATVAAVTWFALSFQSDDDDTAVSCVALDGAYCSIAGRF